MSETPLKKVKVRTKKVKNGERITAEFIENVCARLGENMQVRRNLPELGRLHIDRQMPFLCVYRQPHERPVGTDIGTGGLITGGASYILASGSQKLNKSLQQLVQKIAETMIAQFGTFLIVEVWSSPDEEWDGKRGEADVKPQLRIHAPEEGDLTGLLQVLNSSLSRIRVGKSSAEIETEYADWPAPPGLPSILRESIAEKIGCVVVGIDVRPIYRNPKTDDVFPLVARSLRRQLARALNQTFYHFAIKHTTHRPKHYHSLGRKAVVKAVWEADERLAKVSDAFDFLLLVSPVNTNTARRAFERHHFERIPEFQYRPLPVDPVLLKRKLFDNPIERIEDPALMDIFRQKQDELDRKITMLMDIDTPRFLLGSQQVYGRVDDELLTLAKELLENLSSRARDDSRGGFIDANAMAERGMAEIDYYRQFMPEMKAKVRMRKDIASGLMVSRGSLLVREKTKFPKGRVDALLHHEIGTHLLTYYNGRSQPFRQLYSGLADYESLQEGLAVFAEYLAGGLSRPRMRTLAARVVAARALADGATFVDTFRLLDRDYDFNQNVAFSITMRIYRGGGLTKDAIYLRGFKELLDYIRKGNSLDELYVGKIATRHLPVMRELLRRDVLMPAPLKPRYYDNPAAQKRLARAKEDISIFDLVSGKQ